MSYKLQVISMLLLLGVLLPAKASAHVLKSDGSIGAILHISPDDDPVAGEHTNFFFEFKDKENKFKPGNCDCNGVILQGGKEIYSEPIFQDSPNSSLENASFSYTFPNKGLYKIRVSGKPTASGEFEQFILTWDIRVERDKGEKTAEEISEGSKEKSWISGHLIHIVLIATASLFMLYVIIKSKGGDRKIKNEK